MSGRYPRRPTTPLLVLVGLLAVLGLGVQAQPSAPIYLQYEGFARASDGRYLLWFGYFNLNHVDVTIPAGPDNAFLPTPAQREQPVTFLKGRHRFACTMLVPRAASEPVQWTVRFAGHTSMTTALIFDPIYALEEESVKRGSVGLNVSDAPDGVCAGRTTTPAASPETARNISGRLPLLGRSPWAGL